MSKNRMHITPRPDGWAGIREGNKRASFIAPTQAEAEARVKDTLRREGGGEAVIHDRKNRIRDSDTVAPANDPNPPTDQKLRSTTMQTIRMAHLQTQGINYAVFDADATSRTQHGRAEVLAELTARARADGLAVEKSALAFREGGRLRFFGTPDLVRYLASGWWPQWTHTLTVT